ncbi:hypothetical protein PC129_g7206 [Phytophthora cactorum]|uniref:Uncharacterized protein n=1 Tax=Phytophthora cactorum TaxID=29920 RepID=A0A329T2W8_9STRA|nr:hypothetical protein Pcac1_g23049 [Phytophthora cactorum]KAG2858828.1 hypothetical protein PC113_g9475 [Phytophthora cactorum]KAG2909636.1 hypothetical protein PC114_g10040 [Phytophthora cactorum]KAG2924911.1 hypothetical protein PC115_g8462 [Phytophthora cactorum]KAG2942271.1 hypothetical protein PC117_g9839 [Phytophthora cactorum]
MRAAMNALHMCQRMVENEYRLKVEMPGTLCDTIYPEEMKIVLGMTTRWVPAVLYAQYQVAVDPESASAHSFVYNGHTITVCSRANEFMLAKEDLKSDCEFEVTMQLPCRHAMAHKTFLGAGFTTPFSSIPCR